MDKEFRSNNKNRNRIIYVIIGTILVFSISQQLQPLFAQTEEKKELKIGYFPNINHAQAVIGIGNGDFQKVLGENVTIKPFIFNAGPSAIEALFAKQIDASYMLNKLMLLI